MKSLSVEKMTELNGNGWGCAAALVGSAAGILGLAAATVATGGAAAVVLGGAFLANTAATMAVYDQCLQ